jgi:hypothetical protein
MGNDTKKDELAAELEEALRREEIVAQSFSALDYDLLLEFNWDVRSYAHQAAVHLEHQFTDILHVVMVEKKKGFLSREPGEVLFRAKCLVACPPSVLEGRGHDDDPFSISMKENAEGLWMSDVGGELEESISDSLNRDSELRSVIIHADHFNINAWLEGFTARNYLAINTSKVYSHPRGTVDFVPVSNAIIKAITSFGH